jgi:mannose/cellobiose epimerase-like protein (N-acyl-D-glucosamine 2-epimerase family)
MRAIWSCCWRRYVSKNAKGEPTGGWFGLCARDGTLKARNPKTNSDGKEISWFDDYHALGAIYELLRTE